MYVQLHSKIPSGLGLFSFDFIVFAIVNSVYGVTSKKEFTAKDRKVALFALIGAHVQVLIGLILYFISDKGFVKLGKLE